ncbi:MAG: hypothetical protein ABI606_08770 [Rhodoferax sp.]
MMLAVLRSPGLKLWCGIGLIFLTSLVYAVSPAQKSEAKNTETPLNHGKKWETDDAVRQGMENIREAMTTNQEGIANERLSAQDYERLAETINQNITVIVQTRKVTKAAEKAFHLVVMMDLTQSMLLMRSTSKVQLQRAGALGVLQSLRNYGQYFHHPGWIISA